MPWQILTFIWYPTEAANAYMFNAAHVTVPLDGHVGTFWYHLDKFNKMYGKIASFLIIPAVYISYKKITNKNVFISLTVMVLTVYLFFSVVATKMPSFTIINAMSIMIVFGVFVNTFIEYLISKFNNNKKRFVFAFYSIAIISILLKLDLISLTKKHSILNSENYYSIELFKNRNNFKNLKLEPKTVLFNVNERHYIEAMFYTNAVAYNFIPNEMQLKETIEKGYHPVVYKNQKDSIPSFISNNNQISVRPSFISSYY